MEDAELGGAPFHIHGECEASSIHLYIYIIYIYLHVGHVMKYPDDHRLVRRPNIFSYFTGIVV